MNWNIGWNKAPNSDYDDQQQNTNSRWASKLHGDVKQPPERDTYESISRLGGVACNRFTLAGSDMGTTAQGSGIT